MDITINPYRTILLLDDFFRLSVHLQHLLQPQDLSIFGPLNAGRKRMANSLIHFPGCVNNQCNFCHLLKLGYTRVEELKKKSEIYPFNRNVITPAKLQMFPPNYMKHPRRNMSGKVNARNFRATCENETYLTSTLKRAEPCHLILCRCFHYEFSTTWLNFFLSSSTVSLHDFDHSCNHSETFKIIIPIVKLYAERPT